MKIKNLVAGAVLVLIFMGAQAVGSGTARVLIQNLERMGLDHDSSIPYAVAAMLAVACACFFVRGAIATAVEFAEHYERTRHDSSR